MDLPYLSARSGEMFIFGALTIVVCVDFVVGRDVGCCKLWTIWRQAASFMSRLVRLLIFEQSKISLLTVNKSGIVTLTEQHDMIASVIFM